MRRITSLLAVTALAGIAITSAPAATAATSSADIDGTVGVRVDDEGSRIAMRYVGDPAPTGYDDSYQWGEPLIVTASPEEGPVTMVGTLDLSDMEHGHTAIIGLYDLDALAAGDSAHKDDNGLFVAHLGDVYRIGVSDGDAGGGERVQSFTDFNVGELTQPISVELVVDGTADPATCASNPLDVPSADGCLTLTVNGVQVANDSYGTLNAGGGAVELGNGAHPGWWGAGFEESETTTGTGVDFDLTVGSVVVTAPQSVEDCKQGGYAQFDFENQGECVSSLRANENAGK